MCEIRNTTQLSHLRTYYIKNRNKDIVSKLIHLLELEEKAVLTITREKPFGDITIEPCHKPQEAAITITDKQGFEYQFDWLELSQNQQNKVIQDIKTHRIFCTPVKAK